MLLQTKTKKSTSKTPKKGKRSITNIMHPTQDLTKCGRWNSSLRVEMSQTKKCSDSSQISRLKLLKPFVKLRE